MSRVLEDLAAHLASPDQVQRTPVERGYAVTSGLGIVKSINADGSVNLFYNGGMGDGTTSGTGPGIPANILGNYVPQIGDSVLVLSLGTQNWVIQAPAPVTPAWVNVGDTGAPGFGSGWANFGVGYNVAGYRRIGDTVQLRGLVVSANSPVSTIFSLPSDYIPVEQSIFAAMGNGTIARVDVSQTGDVLLVLGSASSYLSLDGLFFAVT
jgi:hypothetical protein